MIHQVSVAAQSANKWNLEHCRTYGKQLGLHVEAYGDNGEYGWQHSAIKEDEEL